MNELLFYTFDSIEMVPGPVTDEVARANLQRLNAALGDERRYTLIGLAKEYRIAQTTEGASILSIDLQSGCRVVCLPGCTIKWAFSSKAVGSDRGVVNGAADVTDASWTGGTFAGIPTAGLLPRGSVVSIEGSRVLLKDVTIDGYNGIALRIAGDDVTIVNPTVRNPEDDPVDGAGIRVYSGKRFRCYGGSVDAGGDGALQFSGDGHFDVDPNNPRPIEDGLFQGVQCTSILGRLLLVGSTAPAIENVRFVGITGAKTGAGGCIRVQNRGTKADRIPRPIRGVVFRDITLAQVASDSMDKPAIGIENELLSSEGDLTISDIVFDNVSMTTPAYTAFACWAAASSAQRPIRNVSWRGGAIAAPADATADTPVMSISQLDGGVFRGLRITAGTHGPAIVFGDSVTYSTVGCANVVLEDVAITGVAAGQVGVRFKAATNCGFVRGNIAGSAAGTTGVDATGGAANCFVEGTDLTGLTAVAKVTLPSGKGHRACNLRGDALALIPALGTGARADAAMPADAIDGRAGFLAVKRTTGASPPISLKTVSGGAPGDLLLLTRSADGLSINARDGIGNLALQGNDVLDSGDDLLTLVRRDGGWSELARSNNA